jgi:hypothetical protein
MWFFHIESKLGSTVLHIEGTDRPSFDGGCESKRVGPLQSERNPFILKWLTAVLDEYRRIAELRVISARFRARSKQDLTRPAEPAGLSIQTVPVRRLPFPGRP